MGRACPHSARLHQAPARRHGAVAECAAHGQDASIRGHRLGRLQRAVAPNPKALSFAQVGFKRTGRACTAPGCGGRLRDSTLDWEDALPEDELKASEAAADAAGLALCLGTSLLVRPACNLPLRTVRKGA